MRADVAEALEGHRRAFELEALLLRPLDDAVDGALSGGLRATERSAGRDRLAGDDALDALLVRSADHVRVRVHHPRHRLAVRADVGRGDVVLGSDVLTERVGEATRDLLELVLRDPVRVELDAALAAAERDAHQRALPRHHRSERLDVVERDRRVVTHTALERSEQVVVLDAVALEELHLTVVHADREVDDELVLRLAQDRPNVIGQIDRAGCAVEIVLDDLEEVVLLHDDRARRSGSSWNHVLRGSAR